MGIPSIVQNYIETCSPATLNTFLTTFASDATYSDPGTLQPLSGEGIRMYLGGLFLAFPDTVFETTALHIISDTLIAWCWTMRGTNTGSFAGLPPTQRQIVLPGCEFIELVDGKVQRVQGYFDRMTMMVQLGLVPAQPAA